jgi:FMN-dependent NADH-azoreductase
MTNVLLITSSPRGENAYSTQVARDLIAQIGDTHVTVRDLSRDSLPHIGPDFVAASYTRAADRTAEQRAALALSDTLIGELQAADVVVIASGMINFGVPSSLKAWIDHVARAGVTFRYGANGPEGLITGKRAILVVASGGVYSEGPLAAINHFEPHLRAVLGFLGIKNIETVAIEGVGKGAEAVENALNGARTKVGNLALALAA